MIHGRAPAPARPRRRTGRTQAPLDRFLLNLARIRLDSTLREFLCPIEKLPVVRFGDGPMPLRAWPSSASACDYLDQTFWKGSHFSCDGSDCVRHGGKSCSACHPVEATIKCPRPLALQGVLMGGLGRSSGQRTRGRRGHELRRGGGVQRRRASHARHGASGTWQVPTPAHGCEAETAFLSPRPWSVTDVSQLRRMLERKATRVHEGSAAETSQAFRSCGTNRSAAVKLQSGFKCVRCGNECNAGVNVATNIMAWATGASGRRRA